MLISPYLLLAKMLNVRLQHTNLSSYLQQETAANNQKETSLESCTISCKTAYMQVARQRICTLFILEGMQMRMICISFHQSSDPYDLAPATNTNINEPMQWLQLPTSALTNPCSNMHYTCHKIHILYYYHCVAPLQVASCTLRKALHTI